MLGSTETGASAATAGGDGAVGVPGGLFPGYDSETPPAWGPTDAGSSLLAARGDHTHPILRVANRAALAALSAATMADGTPCWVDTYGAAFVLQTSALATEADSVITAAGAAGKQWVRRNAHNPIWEAQAAWFVDPQNTYATSSNENTGLTTATALRSYTELYRRLFDALITTARTVTCGSSLVAGDTPVFNFRTIPGVAVTFEGVPTDIYTTGTITTWTPEAATAAADDNRLVDSNIPVSFTASGLMANAVLFRRTNSTAVYWWGAADLGTKTLRTGAPFTLTGGAGALANGDTWSAATLPTIGALRFSQILAGAVTFRFLHHIDSVTNSSAGNPIRYSHCWRTGQVMYNVQRATNMAMQVGAGFANAVLIGNTLINLSGMFRGAGDSYVLLTNLNGSANLSLGLLTFQGTQFGAEAATTAVLNQRLSIHDTTIPMVTAQYNGALLMLIDGCVGGMGNADKIFSVDGSGSHGGGRIVLQAVTPAVAGSTSDANPVLIGGASSTLAALPAITQVNPVTLVGGVNYP